MQRILIIVLLNVAISLGCRPPPCHWSDSKPIEEYFDKVARKVIDADRKAQQFCNAQGSSNVLEVHTKTKYKLILPGAGATVYEVKVRDRVVQIVSDQCQNSVTDLKILPAYVNGYEGYYYIDDNDLGIAFPYQYDPAVGGGTCEEVNQNVQTLYQNKCKYCSFMGNID